MLGIDAKKLIKENILKFRISNHDSSSREYSSAYTFDTPVWYEVNYWLLGYRPACVACSRVCVRAYVYLHVFMCACILRA